MTGTEHALAAAGAGQDEQSPMGGQVGAISEHPRSIMDQVFRWLPVGTIPIVGLVIFRRLDKPISDPDTFWHLRLGTYLWDTWNFVGPEPWSALADQPLVLHEWSPELLYVAAYRVTGWSGLSYLQAVGGLALLLTLYLCTRQFATPLVAALTATAAWVGASGSVALRPQVVSFILLAVVVTAWLKTFDDGRARWWLIPLTWAWACSHGMWFVGTGVGAAAVVGMVLDRRLTLRSSLRMVMIPVAGVLAAALTPVGPRLLASPGSIRDFTRFVSEWQTPSPFMPQSLVTLGIAGALILIWTKTAARPSWTDLLLFGAGMACTLVYARTIALGAIILGLLAARALAELTPTSTQRQLERRKEVAVLGVGIVLVCLLGPVTSTVDVSEPAQVPTAFNAKLDALPADAVVFNDYQLGGWLLWEHPTLDPVLDGRADVYTVEHFENVIKAYGLAPGWEETLQDSGASAAVLKADAALPAAMESYLGWTRVASDEGYALLMPPTR